MNQQHLDRIVQASARERFYSPILPERGLLMFATGTGALPRVYDFCWALTSRAMLRLHDGQIDAAWNDLHAACRVTRLFARNPSLLTTLNARATDDSNLRFILHLLDDRRLTSGQLARIRRDFEALPDFPSLASVIDRFDRFEILDAICDVERGDNRILYENSVAAALKQKTPNDTLLDRLLAKADFNELLTLANRFIDRKVAAYRMPTIVSRRAGFNTLHKEFFLDDADFPKQAVSLLDRDAQAADISRFILRRIASMQFNFSELTVNPGIEVAENRWRMRARLVEIAFALAQWRLEHGRYPDSLDQLLPKYLKEIPADLYRNRPPVYRSNGEGFILYAVGENGVDDGGRLGFEYDDIVLRTSRYPAPSVHMDRDQK